MSRQSTPSHSDTGEWEQLMRAARSGSGTPISPRSFAGKPSLRSSSVSPAPRSSVHSPGPVLTPAQSSHRSVGGVHTEPTARHTTHSPSIAHHSMATPSVRIGFAAFDESTMRSSSRPTTAPAGAFSASSSSSSSTPATAAQEANSQLTAGMLHGTSFALRTLHRLASGEKELDALRARLHSLACIRPVAEEGLNYPGFDGGAEEAALAHGGYKPGSWVSSSVAASSPLFRKKLHTQHHAFAGLPVEHGGAALFVPNTFLLWLLFVNLDTAGKGYVSTEDYALFLAKHCSDSVDGPSSPDRSHRAQMDMEDFLEADDIPRHAQAHTISTPYYPHSPFRPSDSSRLRSPQRGGNSSLDDARAFLSGSGSGSGRLRSGAAPPMPTPEDILAVFRKHDRAGHGRLGFAHFCRAFVPLLPSRPVDDVFEASYAELPKPFSTFLEPADEPTSSHGRSPTSPQHARTETWSAMQPVAAGAGLLSRLTLEQEQSLVELLLHEIALESSLNFDSLQLKQLTVGRAPPSRSNPSGTADAFDLIDVYSYLDADTDGFLSSAELHAAYGKFDITSDIRDVSYSIWRLDRDNDGQVVYMDWAELFMSYAPLRPYSDERGHTRHINPHTAFPFDANAAFKLDAHTLSSLLNPPLASLTEEEREEARAREEDEREIERQRKRTEELEKKIKEDRNRRATANGIASAAGASLDSPPFQSPLQQTQTRMEYPSTEKRRVSFGGIAGPSSPVRVDTATPTTQQNLTPDFAHSHRSFSSPASVSISGEFDPHHQHHFQPIHAHLFHRPVPEPEGSRDITADKIVDGMTPENLEADLPTDYPFILHKPLAHTPAIDPHVMPSATQAANGSTKSIVQIRMEQLRAHQEFSRQLSLQQQQREAAYQTRPTASPLSTPGPDSLASRPNSASRTHSSQPHVHVRVASNTASRSRVASPFHQTVRAPSLASQSPITQAEEEIEVDVWCGDETKTNDTVRHFNRSQSPFQSSWTSASIAASPAQSQPFSIPVVYSDATATPAPSRSPYAGPPPASFVHPKITPPYPAAPVASESTPIAASARFAPTYPLRFPDETLARSVHQTLYFPIPLGVPSAMLPLSEQRIPNPKLAADITNSALVASLASTQQRASEMRQAEHDRKVEHQQHIHRIQATMRAQASAAAAAAKNTPAPTVSQQAVAHVTAAILPMNHQNTAGSYRLRGATPTTKTATSVPFTPAAGIHPGIYSRPLPAPGALVPPAPIPSATSAAPSPFTATSPLVDFHHQQQMQQLALESIHAHRSVLRQQEVDARTEAAHARQEEVKRRMARQEAELRDLQGTRTSLATQEAERTRTTSDSSLSVSLSSSLRESPAPLTPVESGSEPPLVPKESPPPRPAPGPRHARAFAKTALPPSSFAPATPGITQTGSPKVALLNLRDLASPTPATTRTQSHVAARRFSQNGTDTTPQGLSPTRQGPTEAGATSPLSASAVRNLSTSFARSR